jgi:hypothetical protein
MAKLPINPPVPKTRVVNCPACGAPYSFVPTLPNEHILTVCQTCRRKLRISLVMDVASVSLANE